MAADDPDDLEDDAGDLENEADEPDDEVDDVDALEDDAEGDDLSPDIDGDTSADSDEDSDDDEPAAAKTSSDDDEEEEDLGPDDVEDDLDTILKGKIANEDDLDDDDEDEAEPLVVPVKKSTGEQADGVTTRQEGEFSCPGCYMVVHPRQFGRRLNPTCPSGEEDCPGIAMVFGTL